MQATHVSTQTTPYTVNSRGYCYDCSIENRNGKVPCQCGSTCHVTSQFLNGDEISRKCACDCRNSLAIEPNASCE